MTAFEFFSVALSFVLGLGLTRLLLGGLHTFRARRRQKPHWIPITWAVSIFIYQVQYWWAIFELNSLIDAWTHGRFVTLLSLAMLLFVAGALILPTSANDEQDALIDYFDDDGRWALLALTAYSALALWANWYLFAAPPLSATGLFVIAFSLISLTAFLTSDRRILGVLTVTYLLMAIGSYFALAPSEY